MSSQFVGPAGRGEPGAPPPADRPLLPTQPRPPTTSRPRDDEGGVLPLARPHDAGLSLASRPPLEGRSPELVLGW